MKINSVSVRGPSSASTAVRARAATAAAARPPATRDAFVSDASARQALVKLGATAGTTISAAELTRAIAQGTSDPDSQAAGAEFREFARFAQQQGGRLSEGAKQVMELYARTAKVAQAAGETGLTGAQSQKMLGAMQRVGEPQAAAVKSAKDWQREAMRNADSIFKRQARDPRWNPNGPSSSGNCAICSLAMAVEAFGREPGRFDKPRHVMDQQSIAYTAHHMPGKTDVELVRRGGKWVRVHTGDFKITSARQVRSGAKALGLHAAYRYAPGLKTIDRALAQGHMMVLGGEAGAKFRGAIGHTYTGGHSVLIMGKTADGHYLVADPLSRKGPVKLSADELRSFDTSAHTSNEVWRGK